MKDISLLGHPIITMHKVCFLNEKIQDHLLKKKLDLSLSQYMVLVFLSLKPGQSQEDLAVRRNSTEASISRTVKILIRKKFITCQPDLADKRKKKLFLSGSGQKLLVRAKNIVSQEFNSFLREIDKDEGEELERNLEKILKAITDRGQRLSIIKQENK